jgi:hypothetical protein
MARSKDTYNKREKEKQRQKEKQEKKERMEERKAKQVKGKSLNDMMAYIDENGNISSTPPDPSRKRFWFYYQQYRSKDILSCKSTYGAYT